MIQRLSKSRHKDEGMTLVELIIAMGLFSILLSILMVAVASWMRTGAATARAADNAAEARKVFDSFDRNLLSASEINRPVKIGNDWYVEMLDATATTKTCRQWVFRGATGVVATREWVTGAPTSAPAWQTLGTRFVSEGVSPFVMSPVSSDTVNASLKVDLASGKPVQHTTGVFVARNSTLSSVTMPDANGDGVSDTQVCLSDFSGARS